MPTYRMTRDSLHEKFSQSRAKVQMFGGGFANGKTAAAIVLKVLPVARDYPGANILVARATYPKLNDTIRKEFFKWCPKHWIKSFSKAENVCELVNGTTINFRYIAQQGKSAESTTSNLLSATYDLIVVDQIEDPEITGKDFYDLLGRLRGMAPYVGHDPTMPRTGPRWIIVTTNPTRNWVYRELVRPVHRYHQTGGRQRDPSLLVDEHGQPIIELFEGSTYENAENLEEDFIKTLESAYKGQMRDRFLLGKWAAYEGLVYPMFDEDIHVVPNIEMRKLYERLKLTTASLTVLESYDHGIAVPSCYLFGFADEEGNVHVMNCHYEKEMTIADHAEAINDIRRQNRSDRLNRILADPSVFRRTGSDSKTVGRTTADMFEEYGLYMEAGNNDIINGIHKIQQYLTIEQNHKNPYTEQWGAPRLYISDACEPLVSEFVEYYWMKDTTGQQMDKPVDKRNDAMDSIKYLMSRRPKLSIPLPKPHTLVPAYMKWREFDAKQRNNSHRYG